MNSSSRLTPVKQGDGASSDSIARDAWVEVDLNRLESNLQTIKAHLEEQAKKIGIKPPLIMGVVKADAYGHGAIQVSEVLAACGISWLGVASADEGSELRRAGCKLSILILSPTPSWAARKAIDQGLDLTISSVEQLQEIAALVKNDRSRVRVHLKVDTGMHRLGMNFDDSKKAIILLKESKKFKLVSVFSHLAKAGDSKTTEKQIKEFDHFIELFKEAKFEPDFYHLACSEAAHHFPSTYYDLVRIGINIYGLEADTVSDELAPIMSVRGRINQINTIDKNEAVGYGLTWKAERPTRLANIPIGYADGVGRRLSNKMQGLLHHKLIKQVGTISMDQMLFDITDVPAAREGDVITLIGSDDYALSQGSEKSLEKSTLNLADWACELDTITYELACRLKVRLSRIYTRKRLKEQVRNSPLFMASEKDK